MRFVGYENGSEAVHEVLPAQTRTRRALLELFPTGEKMMVRTKLRVWV